MSYDLMEGEMKDGTDRIWIGVAQQDGVVTRDVITDRTGKTFDVLVLPRSAADWLGIAMAAYVKDPAIRQNVESEWAPEYDDVTGEPIE